MCSIKYLINLLLFLVFVHGQENKLFVKRHPFAHYPNPTFSIYSPELGPTGSNMSLQHSADGLGLFPALSWQAPTAAIKEYVLVIEDPDAPLSEPVVHGLYYGIPRIFTGVSDKDFEKDRKKESPVMLVGGFKYGENRGGCIYLAPSPPRSQGAHRYFYQLVALGESIDQGKIGDIATIDQIAQEVEGKVVGYGLWVGYMRRD